MPNPFDSLKVAAFDTVTATMGYDAVWVCRDEEGEIEEEVPARVLLNYPSQEESVADHEFDYARPKVEFKAQDWEGLKELVDTKSPQEIRLEGKNYYIIKIIGDKIRAADGEVYTGVLENKP